jgi:putative transposase
MARLARVVFPGYPHHVTTRGNRRQDVFCDVKDRRDFIDLLAEYTQKFHLAIWAWVLMTNHIHLVATPHSARSLSNSMRDSLSDYALAFNRRYDYTGHLWQGRFYSSVMDADHLWSTVRYVERNPVRAGLVERAEHYLWSSAGFHCGLRAADPLVTPDSPLIGALNNWSAWLRDPDEQGAIDRIRKNTRTGRPTGSNDFVNQLEAKLGRTLRRKSQKMHTT